MPLFEPKQKETFIAGLQALGSAVKFVTLGISNGPSGSTTMVDGRAVYSAIYLDRPTLLTGVMWYMATQGSYTADNNNYIALYTIASGTLTQVAISSNDGNLWKASTGSYVSTPFTAQYAAAAGIYFIGVLWNASATTTAPVIGATTIGASGNVPAFDLPNSVKICGTVTSQTTLPASQAMSGVSGLQAVSWLALY